MSTEASQQAQPHVIHYTVDDEPQQTTEHELTPHQILTNAGISAGDHYLVEIEGNHRKSYKDVPDEPIHMHEHQKFASVFTGTVPVS
jgi:hypothetical protein